jgi:anti-sigma factor (TIGR02949 family)
MIDLSQCEEITQQLDWYLDGELALEEKERVDAHLQECADCRQQAQLMAKIKSGLSGHQRRTDEVPQDLAARILRETHSCTKGPIQIWSQRFIVSGAAAAACLMLALSVNSNQERPLFLGKLVKKAVAQHRLQVPMDVASPDAKTVASFVQSRLGSEMKVPNLQEAGFILRGARLISVADEKVAQLRYRGSLGEELSLLAVLNKGEGLNQMWNNLTGDEEGTPDLYAGLSGSVGDLPVMIWQNEGAFYTAVGKIAPDKLYASVIHEGPSKKAIQEVLLAKQQKEKLTPTTDRAVHGPSIRWQRAFRSSGHQGGTQSAVYRP